MAPNHDGTRSSTSQHKGNPSAATERTSLLAKPHGRGSTNLDEALTDEDEIDPNEFDVLLSQSNSINTVMGVEAESQETPMLRGHRTYGTASRRSSNASRRPRKSFASTRSQEVIPENDEEDGPLNKSPYIGVSVWKFWLIYGNTLACFFIACFDSTIMVSSHPVITSYFHSSNSASWLSTAFLLTSTSFQPIFGRLSDTIGRKRPYVLTLGIFMLATVWCGLAQSMTSFILARAVCGLGAGGMMSLGAIITSDLVPIEIRGAYQGYINIVFGAGSALGAALGGAIADHLGWRWEFGVQIPAMLLCWILACITMPNDLGLADGVKQKSVWQAMKAFDYWGSLLLTTSITFFILGLNLGGNVLPWSHPFVIASLIIFSVLFPVFIWWESRVALPIMPLHLILHNPRAGIIMAGAVTAIVVNAIIFNIPLYFQAVLLESATTSGLRLIFSSISSSIAGTATGFLITWTRQLKVWMMLGSVLLVVGSVSLSVMWRGLPHWVYMLFLIPAGMGQGFVFPTTFMSVLAVSEQAEQAVVTSTLILWRSLGMVLGVAASSLVLQNALVIFLNEKVTGPDRLQVIEDVRNSVQAIAKLAPHYQEQVIDSYAAALRSTFTATACVSLVTFLIVLYIKLPKLGQRK